MWYEFGKFGFVDEYLSEYYYQYRMTHKQFPALQTAVHKLARELRDGKA